MKRAGFTMIELIFVIVILGILSAVAVPKMMGVSEKANAGVCKSYYSSLNRTVSPTLWSNMVIDGTALATAYSETEIAKQIETPANDKCGAIADISDIATEVGDNAFTVTVGDNTYDVNGTQASSSAAATWTWSKH